MHAARGPRQTGCQGERGPGGAFRIDLREGQQLSSTCALPAVPAPGAQGCDNMSVVVVVLKPFADHILSKQTQQKGGAAKAAAA